MKIGFIGQGWIGKNYADDFEARGFDTVRFALEEPYRNNGDLIAGCDIVFIAVPTPTRKEKIDDSIVRQAIKKVGKGKIAVIKSTILPGTTESIQKENPDIFVLHSPEFLREKTAAYDAAHPDRNIIGVPEKNDLFLEKANIVMQVLPSAPYQSVCQAKEAEMVKYAGNCFFYIKVIYVNLLYDLANHLGCDWEVIREALAAEPRIGASHLSPTFDGFRGVWGHCFPKDFAAFNTFFEEHLDDPRGLKIFKAIKEKNIELLSQFGRDMDLMEDIYGKDEITKILSQ